jgi:PIN domain nuclease of toxin-antitoxin system
MAPVVRLDTHVVVWLFTGEVERLSPPARARLAVSDVTISPMVELELTYLHEIGRLTVSGAEIIGDMAERTGLIRSMIPFRAAVAAAASLSWTRDPFDRLIVADALAAGSELITKDESIRANCSLALW